MAKGTDRQPYPREEKDLLSKSNMFPILNPPLSLEEIRTAIEKAFSRSNKTKKGELKDIPDSPEKLVKLCIRHIMERTDPVVGTSFYSQFNLDELFEMDGIPHEMQRQRMQIGVFYQYLIIELMAASIQKGNSNIIRAFDGTREGDVTADIRTPNFEKNLRLYISVKKSADTVGGQDIGGVIRRLEKIAKQEKNLTTPYLCVIAIATPTRGKILEYNKSRYVRYTQEEQPYSENCEIWMPGFIFPYITGRSAIEVYKESLKIIESKMPFYSLKYRARCNDLLKKEFIRLGLTTPEGEIDREKLFQFVAHES